VAGQDVDFICWGPFNSLTGICNNLTAANVIDCSYSGSYTETLNIPNGITGQYYMVLITNFANTTQNIQFTQYGGTGNTNCALLTNSSICAGKNYTIVAQNSTNLSNPSYSLFPGGLTNNTGTFIVTPQVTTSYTTYLAGTNNANVVVTQTAVTNVTVNPQPSSAPTATQMTCTNTVSAINLGVSFFPALPVPSYTVAWVPVPFGITTNSQTSTSGGIAPATYSALITAQGGCTNMAVVTVSPPPAPSVFNLVPTGPIYSVTCTQPTVVIDGSDATYSYTWTNGVVAPQTGVSSNYTQFGLGNWTVTGVHPVSGCVSNRTFTVVLNNAPPQSSVSPINQSVTCGPGVVATATGVAINPTVNVSHYWYAPGLASPYISGGQLSIYNPIVGTSTFVLTNNLNGCSTTKTVQVVSIGGNYPNFTVTSFSTSNTFTLGCGTRSVSDVNIVGANTTPPGGVVSYTLLPPSFTGTNYATSPLVPTYTVNSPGTYTLIVKDNSNLCETRLQLAVIQNTFAPNISAEADITRTLTCFTPSVNLIGNSTNTSVDFSWKRSTNPPLITNSVLPVTTTTAGASVPSATVIDNYTLTVFDRNNTCTSTSVVTMYQNIRPPKPGIAFSAPALNCVTYSVNATNNSTTGVLPGTFFGTAGINAILWEGPTPQEPKVNSSTYSGFTPGPYTLTVMDMNNGCTSQTTAVLGDNRVFPVITTTTLIPLDCGTASTVKLMAQVVGMTPGQVTAQWYTPDPTPNIQNPNTLTLTTDGVGFYKLVVTTNTNGCTSSAVVNVTNGVLTAGFTADQETGFAPLTVNFSNTSASSSTATGTSSITSIWSFGNGSTKTTTINTTQAGTSAVFNQAGTYTVTLYATKGSCVSTYSRVITVDIPSKLEVPNVFTPNGDGSNDIFFVRTANLSEITALIYDRWGNKIYELTTEKGNIAWDGKSNTGKEAPDGTYFYIITAKGKDGASYDTKGTVSLFR
jgi:gliding motility-associated-like protein